MRCQRACILPYDKQTYTRLPVMMAQMSCYDHSAVTAKHPVCVCECVIGITTRLLCYSATHLTFIHHPSFLPSLPDSPLIEIYYPHPATGPQCQSDHTLCSRNGHTNHSLMQTVRYIWFGRCVIWNHFILELMDLLFVKMTMFMMRTVSG